MRTCARPQVFFSLTFSLIRSPQVHHRPQLIAETQGATIPINIESALGLFLSHLPFALCLRPTQRSLLVHCTAVTPTATHLMRQDSGAEGPGEAACRYIAFKKPPALFSKLLKLLSESKVTSANAFKGMMQDVTRIIVFIRTTKTKRCT